MLGASCGRQRLLGNRVEAETRRHHQPLLRSAHRDVDFPFVVTDVDRCQRRDGVHDEQRRMAGAVHRAPQIADPADDARRRLVVDDDHGLERVRRVVSRRCSRTSGDAPLRQVPGTYSTLRPSRSATCRHATCENHPVSKIRMRSPGESVLTSADSAAPVPEEGKSRSGLWSGSHRRNRSKDLVRQFGELGSAVVDGRLAPSRAARVRNVGRTRNL